MNLLQRKLLQSLTCCLFILLLFSLPAHSATDNYAAWEFHAAPYAWIAGLDGTCRLDDEIVDHNCGRTVPPG